ncbi:hypothetical protein GOP47_0012736 [Adiantum capillus-veneris]|uniref:Ionotropic glutamate receptor C-terminal domain-containing protein n=1 Tax=Adiantum capillus-veneris TaxID=13818 RepID=A0A9D4UR90_ADICA|nr:hypothetical protein GOP47_0012736 [Adiantum capillus-veneris]
MLEPLSFRTLLPRELLSDDVVFMGTMLGGERAWGQGERVLKAFDVSAKCPNWLTSASLTSRGEARDNSSTLLVLVPWKRSFEQFVKFRPESCLLDGFSIQVFLQALRHMPQSPQYKFVLHGSGDETPSYDGMLDMLLNKKVDAVVADLTITAERSEKVAFTVPYLASSLVMITPFKYGSTGALWGFLKPFSGQLWITLLGCFAVTGAALYLLEGQNPDFARTSKNREGGSSHGGSSSTQGQATLPTNMAAANASPSPSPLSPSPPPTARLPAAEAPTPPSHDHNPNPLPLAVDTPIQDQASHKRRIMNAYWFTSLCLFQAQQESVRTHLGRIVTVTWLFVMLIFNSSYTASLASLLSAQKRYPTIDGFQALLRDKSISVGYQQGSFMKTYMDKLDLEGHTIKTFTSERDYAEALRAGNLNPNGVGAWLEELPYIQILLQTECDITQSSTEDDHLPSFGGFGFAFRKGNPLNDHVSKAILEMAEDGTLQILQNGWKIGDKKGRCSSNSEPTRLRLKSFGGLFSIVAAVYVACLIWHLMTKAIKSREGSCGPLIQALPCTQHGANIQRRGDLSLSRRSNRVHDESQNDQIS